MIIKRLQLAISLLISLVMLMGLMPGVSAISKEQKKVFYGHILAYDVFGDECGPDGSGAGGGGAGGGAGGGGGASANEANAEIAYDYFASTDRLGSGGNPNARQQAAGIVGNLIVESGVDPRKQQYGGGPGRGIAQWSVDERWANLLRFAQAHQADPLELRTQLDYMWFEMTGKPPTDGATGNSESGSLADLRAQTTPPAAAESFMKKYERPNPDPNVNHIDLRKSEAQRIFDAYSDNPQGTIGDGLGIGGPGGAAAAGDCPGAGGSGTVNSDGYAFPLEGRKDEIAAYTALPCTAGPSGCHHDGTPAFDLHVGQGNATVGRQVYAIHKGIAESVKSGYHDVDRCYSIQFKQTGSKNSSDDGWYYWYGHIENPKVRQGQEVPAGTQLAQVGDAVCATSPQTHLHIDRGSPKGHTGGEDAHRDPGFIDLINTLYEELP